MAQESPFISGFRLVDGDDLNRQMAYPRVSYEPAVGGTFVANPGGGQANAKLIQNRVTRITAVASANDSVRLPMARPGIVHYITNAGANSAQLFGTGTDIINAAAAGTGVALAAGKSAVVFCAVAGIWSMVLSA